MKKVILLASLLFVVGCAKDKRVARQAELNHTEAVTAQSEMDATPDKDKKIAIAQDYFSRAPKQLRIVADYLEDRKPADPPPTPATVPAPATPVVQP